MLLLLVACVEPAESDPASPGTFVSSDVCLDYAACVEVFDPAIDTDAECAREVMLMTSFGECSPNSVWTDLQLAEWLAEAGCPHADVETDCEARCVFNFVPEACSTEPLEGTIWGDRFLECLDDCA